MYAVSKPSNEFCHTNAMSSSLAQLSDPHPSLQLAALQSLLLTVDLDWPSLASHLPLLESLAESRFPDSSSISSESRFPNSSLFPESRFLAALLVSKIYFHLEALDEAVKYALLAGPEFEKEDDCSEFGLAIRGKCVEKYLDSRQSNTSQKEDARLEGIVEGLLERCAKQGEKKNALGIALEARRLDIVREIVSTDGNALKLLEYTFEVAKEHIVHREFRKQVLQLIVELYSEQTVPDYIEMAQALFILDNAAGVGTILNKLVKQDQDSTLMAYQIAFTLNEHQNQPFMLRIVASLPQVTIVTDDAATSSVASGASESVAAIYNTRLKNLLSILTGELPTELHLQFLYSQHHSDHLIIQTIKDKQEVRNSVTNSCTVLAHAMMQCGTTVDTFLRENLDWLSRAANWAKFSATASIGVIHKGHRNESTKLLGSYLPTIGSQGSVYQEGGALYALGLIHANHGGEQVDYFMEQIRGARDEVIKHGACLGLGLAAMATGREDILEELLNSVVYTDDAVAGEAAALAMGLIMAGYGNTKLIDDMLQFAHDTKHEKIIRGIGVGIAISMYALEENADIIIERLLLDKDPVLRYSGVYTVALAFVGTSNNNSIKRLLLLAVSDVSDDVRRAAVTAIGFVMCNNPKQVPRVVELLAESFNPHVRYGAAMAVGIAAAGTAGTEALNLLFPLLRDRVDYVRQAAFIACSMVLIQVNSAAEPRVLELRKMISETMDNKFADTMTKMGAIFGAGILDGGGRNCTLSLLSPSGHKKMACIIGMAMFSQFWYWYPLTHFISLSFSPTVLIGLGKDLLMPKNFSFTSQAKPSLFAYPPPTETKKDVKVKKAPTATLSVTAKAKAKAKAKGKDEDKKEAAIELEKVDAMDVDDKKIEEGESADTKKKEKVSEPTFQVLSNPSRVTAAQQRFIIIDSNGRYVPLVSNAQFSTGFVMLKDTQPEANEEWIETVKPKTLAPDEVEEAPLPQPFTFTR